jgi:hypothetical protein
MTWLDDVASDLAAWIDDTATQIALAMAPRGQQPFAAQMTEQQKLAYYTARLFNPDGSPNMQGRTQELQRLGPEGFAGVYKAVIKAHPELHVPTPPAGAPIPSPLAPVPPAIGAQPPAPPPLPPAPVLPGG